MPLPLFVGCAVEDLTNHAQKLISKVPIALDTIAASPLALTITSSTYYGQFLNRISEVDATLFACHFTKLYRSYYPLPIIVIVKPVTKKDIFMKMLDSFIANEFMTGTFISILLLLTTSYIVPSKVSHFFHFLK